MSAMKPKMFIVVTCKITKENNFYVASCPELDVVSQGKTIEEANDNIKDATLLYLNTIEELGTRKEIFGKKKIKIYTTIPRSKKEVISVPKDNNHDSYITVQPIPLAC